MVNRDSGLVLQVSGSMPSHFRTAPQPLPLSNYPAFSWFPLREIFKLPFSHEPSWTVRHFRSIQANPLSISEPLSREGNHIFGKEPFRSEYVYLRHCSGAGRVSFKVILPFHTTVRLIPNRHSAGALRTRAKERRQASGTVRTGYNRFATYAAAISE